MEYWANLNKFCHCNFLTFLHYSIPPAFLRNPYSLDAILSRGIISFGDNLLIILYRRYHLIRFK
jgi:hypothetical protein